MDFKNKIVRDLDNSINSEYLLNDDLVLPNSFLNIYKATYYDWLIELDKNPEDLVFFIENNHSRRLGKYFENLLHYFFIFHPNIEVLEFGKQIFNGKITIGEMDFILMNKTSKEIIHLEVAVKYFAKKKGESDFKYFICPNGKRNFDDKIEKTFGKQLRITERPETKALLNKKNYFPIKSYHFIKGILFYHTDEIDTFEHSNLNPNHKKSWWMFQKEIMELNNESKYKIVHKLKWLSEEIEEDESELLSKKELMGVLSSHFEIISQGQLIVEFEKSELLWRERSRGFVVDNEWPQLK